MDFIRSTVYILTHPRDPELPTEGRIALQALWVAVVIMWVRVAATFF